MAASHNIAGFVVAFSSTPLAGGKGGRAELEDSPGRRSSSRHEAECGVEEVKQR